MIKANETLLVKPDGQTQCLFVMNIELMPFKQVQHCFDMMQGVIVTVRFAICAVQPVIPCLRRHAGYRKRREVKKKQDLILLVTAKPKYRFILSIKCSELSHDRDHICACSLRLYATKRSWMATQVGIWIRHARSHLSNTPKPRRFSISYVHPPDSSPT